jgi:hypothetical protein
MSDDIIRPRSQATDGQLSARSSGRPSGLQTWLPWILAAGFALLTALLAQIYYATQAELIALQEQMALARLEVSSLQLQGEAEQILSARRVDDLASELHAQSRPGVEIVPLLPRTAEASSSVAVAVWSPGRQDGELVVERLPMLPPDKSYQLWITEPGNPVPASAGAFTVDQTAPITRIQYKADRPVPAGVVFAISVERRGGAAKVEGPIVLSSH